MFHDLSAFDRSAYVSALPVDERLSSQLAGVGLELPAAEHAGQGLATLPLDRLLTIVSLGLIAWTPVVAGALMIAR